MATTKTKKATGNKRAPKAATTPKAQQKVLTGKVGELPVYKADGTSAGVIALPDAIFAARWNADLVHQVVTGMQANARPVTANTKHRGEVRGGGKKPWKQKGTGRARHGSSRSPIWKGGGVTHGPRAERDYTVKLNKKMRKAALVAVLSKKAKDGEIIFIEKLGYSAPKTKDAVTMLRAVSKAAGAGSLITKARNAGLVVFAEPTEAMKKSFRNIGNLAIEEIRNINPVDVMTSRYLVIENPAKAIELLTTRLG